MNSRSGLTFIELFIVILIIGLIMAIVAPNFVNLLRSTKTGSAARRLAGYMKYVQDKAARENTEYIVVFDLKLNQYWAATELPEEEMPPEYYYVTESERLKMRYPVYKDKDGFLERVDLEPGITIPLIIDEKNYEHTGDTDGYYNIFFYPDGTATRTTLYIQGHDEEIITIYIKPFTGEAEIYEGYRKIDPLPELTEED